MKIESVSLLEIVAAARARHASLVPESAGYLILAMGQACGGLPVRLDATRVSLTTEGQVVLSGPREQAAEGSCARHVAQILQVLLDAAQGPGAALRTAAITLGPQPPTLGAVYRAIAKALIPLNRSAARRALARLARETVRAPDCGAEQLAELRAALRAPESATAAPAIADGAVTEASAPQDAPAAASIEEQTDEGPSCTDDEPAQMEAGEEPAAAIWQDIEIELATPTPSPAGADRPSQQPTPTVVDAAQPCGPPPPASSDAQPPVSAESPIVEVDAVAAPAASDDTAPEVADEAVPDADGEAAAEPATAAASPADAEIAETRPSTTPAIGSAHLGTHELLAALDERTAELLEPPVAAEQPVDDDEPAAAPAPTRATLLGPAPRELRAEPTAPPTSPATPTATVAADETDADREEDEDGDGSPAEQLEPEQTTVAGDEPPAPSAAIDSIAAEQAFAERLVQALGRRRRGARGRHRTRRVGGKPRPVAARLRSAERSPDRVDALLSSFSASAEEGDPVNEVAASLKRMMALGLSPAPSVVAPIADRAAITCAPAEPGVEPVEAPQPVAEPAPVVQPVAAPCREPDSAIPDDSAADESPATAPVVASTERQAPPPPPLPSPPGPHRSARAPVMLSSTLLISGLLALGVIFARGDWRPGQQPAGAAAAAARTPAPHCRATLRLTDLPSPHEVLWALTGAPGATPVLPRGVRLELVAVAPGSRAERLVIDANAAWPAAGGQHTLPLHAQLTAGSLAPWPAAPTGSVGGVGAPGVVRFTASMPSAELWLVAAAGSGHRAELSLPCGRPARLWVVNPRAPATTQRLRVAPTLLEATALRGPTELSVGP